MKKILLSLFALLTCMVTAQAQTTFEKGGIWYQVDSEPWDENPGTAHVIPSEGDDYAGDLVIKAQVINSGTYNVTYIQSKAFKDCDELTSITIPNSITNIGYEAFKNCEQLASVTFSPGSQLTNIEWSVFENCTSLTSIDIPDGVTGISNNVFSGCTSLKSATLPNSVEYFYGSLFSGCESLESFTIPNKMTEIPGSTFQNCSSLTSITIPEKVTSIGGSAFYGCTGLTSITIPENVKTIESSAFSGCTGLTSITIPEKVTTIGSSAFSDCKNLASVEFSGSSKLKTIEGDAFLGCTSLSTFTIPEGVTSIGGRAFSGCTSLTSIEIPSTVKKLGNDGDSSWDGGVFSGCSSLTSITLPSNVKAIKHSTFSDCTSLSSVTILGNVTEIGERAFWSTGLLSITIPSSVKTIGGEAFSESKKLTTVVFDNISESKLKTIEGSAFQNCTSLSSITLPGNVTAIGGQAFQNCSSLTSITIPNSVTEIGEWAFHNCYKLTDVILSDQLTTIEDHVFQSCSGLTSIIIPNSVTTIGQEAFGGCNKLADVQLGNQLTTIERSAFDNSGLTSITIPKSVTTIEDWAFGNCWSITQVISEILEPKVVDAFNNCADRAILFVPDGLIPTYKSLDGWNQFASYLELSDTIYQAQLTDEQGVCYTLNKADDNSVYYAVTSCSDEVKKEIVILADIKGCPVTTVERWAFSGRSITSITIPNSITNIRDDAFRGISGLKQVNSEILNPVEVNAFNWWEENTAIALVVPKDKRPDYKNVKGWKDAAFIFEKGETIYQVSRTDEQDIRYELRLADDNSIYYAVATSFDEVKKEIVIPADLDGCPVTTVDSWAFSGRSITSITIPNSITNIKEHAFKGISGLKQVNSEILVPFEVDAFDWWDGNYALVVPKDKRPDYKSVKGWKDAAFIFEEGETIYQVSRDDEQGVRYELRLAEDNSIYYAVATCTDEVKTEIVIATEFDGLPVTTVESWAFSGRSITSITIPNSITTIKDDAFRGIYGIEVITSEIMVPFEVNAFNWWEDIALVVPKDKRPDYKSVNGWKDCPFIFEVGEEVVVSKTGVADEEQGLYYSLRQSEDDKPYYSVRRNDDKQRTEIVIRTDIDGVPVKAIEEWAFGNYNSLTSLTIPNNIEIIGSYAFYDCTGLKSLEIPNNVTSIGEGAFSGCKNITSITFYNGVENMGNWAFDRCTGLDDLTIHVSDDAKFCNNNVLKVFNNPMESWDDGNYSKKYFAIHLIDSVGNDIKDYVIPEGVTTIGDGAFKGYTALSSITIPNSVTSIGDAAFKGCTGLSSINIPNSVTSIGKEAFRDCGNIASVNMGKNVSSIGNYAFYNCTSLNSITLPKKLESIGDYAFSGDDIWKSAGDKHIPMVPLTSITIPGSVKTIGKGAFRACWDLALVNFEIAEEGGLTSIGDEAFWGCKLTSITIPNTVTTIGSNAFSENYVLTTAILGDGITEIKDETFQSCWELVFVTIPNKVTSIGNYAFRWCSKLNSIKLPESLTTMGEYVFDACQLNSIELPDAFTNITDNLFATNDLGYIKLGKNVKSIGKNAFGSKLHEDEEGGVLLVIDTPTPPAIDKNAFPNYSYLNEINVIVPDAKAEEAYSKAAVWLEMTYANMENEAVVTVNEEGKLSKETLTQCGLYPTKVVSLKVKGSINAEDFDQMRVNMKSLLSLDLSECDITAIPDGAMQGKTQLQELTLPNKLQTIGNFAFQNCSYLTDKLDIPAGVTFIGDNAFEGTYYTSVNLPSKLQTIGHRAFYNLPLKQKIYLPDALTSIGDEAFAETQIYGVADMNNKITYLGWGAFRNTQIDNMFLPEDNLTSVSWGLFQGCSKLGVVGIGIPKNYTEVSGYAFDGCSELTYVRMSPNIESIGEYAFQDTKLEYMKVPSKVEILTWGVFKNCRSLESLSLPADLKQISREALMGCTALRNLSIEAVEPPTVEKNAMLGVNTDRCIISIPSTSFDDYLLADYWGKFVNLRNNIVVETEGNGEIAFESIDEEDDGISDARRASVRRYVAARARAKTRGAEEEDDELRMTFANDGSSIYVPKNGKVRFYIIPAEAEVIQSATLDGVDITADIDEDGVYETTADKKDGQLVVKFSGEGQTEPIKIGKNGKTTYCGDKSLDFSYSNKVKAFIATGFDKNENTIWMTRVKDVPAGVPVMIKGDPEVTYNVPVTDSKNSYYKNMFVGNTTGETVTISAKSEDGMYDNYYMSGGIFKSVNGSANIGNNKCYLQLPANFEAETTGDYLEVKIAASGKSSFAAPYDLDFTDFDDDLKAFTATGFDKSTNTIWLTRVKKVQKGEGLMLKGNGGETYYIPSIGVQAIYENMIVGNISGETLEIGETSDDGLLTNFYLKGGTYMSVKVSASIGNNKSYLQLPSYMLAGARSENATDAADAQTTYDFVEMETESMPIIFASIGEGDGETTGIVSMDNGQLIMDNASDEWYTLNGQRISKPSKKGLYIHNGKKVVIK